MEVKVYNSKGKESGKIKLPDEIFGLKWNADLVHQVVTSSMTASRTPIAHTKDRSEVSGGGKKPWQQKGTGRARHGSSRSPIWVGGGVAHGPRNDKNFDRKINKKAKLKALATILSAKIKDNEILFVDSLGISEPKTKNAISLMVNLSKVSGFEKLLTKKTNSVCVVTSSKNSDIEKSFGNVKNSTVTEVRNVNPLDLLQNKYVVFSDPENSLKVLEDRMK